MIIKYFLPLFFFLANTAKAQVTFYPSDTIWNFKMEKSIMCSPLLEENYVYSGGESGKIYCLDAETGKIKWGFMTGFGGRGKRGIYHSVVSNGKSVFFNNGGNRFYCLGKESGKMNWEFEARFDDDILTNIILADSAVLFSGYDSLIFSLSQKSGKINWQYKFHGRVYPINGNEKNIYFATSDSQLVSVDTKTGKENWKIKSDHKINELKVHVHENLVAFVGPSGIVECIDVKTKKTKWKNNLSPQRMLSFGYNDFLFVLTDDGIKTYDMKTGELKWNYPGRYAWLTEPTFFKDKFYMYCRLESKLIVLDIKTGKELKTKRFSGKSYTSVLVNDKMIYLGIERNFFAIKNEI